MKRGSRAWLAGAALLLAAAFSGCGAGSSQVVQQPPPPPQPETITITTPSPIQCVQNVPFSLTLQETGALSTVTWTILSGQLPVGLSLESSTGIISGTPTAGSGVGVTIQAADAKASISKLFYSNVWTKLTINPAPPPAAHLNAPYLFTVTATASSAIASWSLAGGQLPPGLTLNAINNLNAEAISGTPTQAGTFNFTLQAQDYTIPQTATQDFTLVVDTHLAITKATLKPGRQNEAYSNSFTAVNGTPPFTWTISWSKVGGVPTGLILDPASGTLSGTTASTGGFPYTVTVTDSSATQQSDSAQGVFNIASQLQIIGNLPPAYIGRPYLANLTAIGGFYPYTWSLSSGITPPGLSFYPSGSISGTPTQLGSSNIVLQLTDSGNPPESIQQPFTLDVVPVPLSVGGGPLSPAPVNVPYHSQIPISGGIPPYSFAITSGQLPPGLTFDTSAGFIDGTPTQAGTFNFVAQGTDSQSPAQKATANDFIVIRKGMGRNDSIATATPLGNSANQQTPIPFSISPYIDPINAATPNPDTDFYRLVAAGGSTVHVETYAQRSWGADPLDTVIEILDGSGNRLQTCTSPAFSSVCLNDDLDNTTLDSALDVKVPGSATAQATFYVHVFDWRGDARPDMQYYLNISGVVEPLTITTTTLGTGSTRGANINQPLQSSGGTGSVTWSLDSGALPTGWSLSSAGVISGAATTDGTYTFTGLANDSGSPPQTARQQYTLQIAEPVAITSPATWPNACANQPYSFTVTTTGGLPPIQFSFMSNFWPGLILNQSTGVFSGIPGALGTFQGSLGAIDSASPPSTSGQNISVTVVNCP